MSYCHHGQHQVHDLDDMSEMCVNTSTRRRTAQQVFDFGEVHQNLDKEKIAEQSSN